MGLEGSVEPPLESNFIFMGNPEKMAGKMVKSNPSAKVNPLFKIPGSAPGFAF